jgi:hypothetical protein
MGKKTWLGVAAVLAASGALLSAPAQARSSVVLSLGVPVQQYSYGYPQPVYAQPYVYPQPAYVVPEPYVYVNPGYRHYYGHRHVRRDSDHDGVPNRFDRRPHNPRRY